MIAPCVHVKLLFALRHHECSAGVFNDSIWPAIRRISCFLPRLPSRSPAACHVSKTVCLLCACQRLLPGQEIS